MNQHPVPQHIASFEFKLFGNLTIRQFVTLAIPMSLAALIFFSPITPFIRYPLAVILGLFGTFIALVPIQGRPFDKWIVAFTKAITSPTQRVWVKQAKTPQFLNIVISEQRLSKEPPEPITSQGRQKLLAYLRALPKATVSPLDVKEQSALEKLGLATPRATAPEPAGKLPPPIVWQEQRQQPAPNVINQFQGILAQALPQISPAQTSNGKVSQRAKPFSLPGLEKKLAAPRIEVTPQVQLASDTNFSVENVIPVQAPGKKFRLLRGIAKTRMRKLHFAPPQGFNLSNLPVRGEARFEVSEELKKRFSTEASAPALAPAAPTVVNPPRPSLPPQAPKTASSVPKQGFFTPQSQISFSPQNATLKTEEAQQTDSRISAIKGEKVDGAKPAILSRASIVPLTNTPNVLSGLVSDINGIPTIGAIITVRDQSGIPVRALKTNKLGQFLSTTPLNMGNYSLEIEHETNAFDPISIALSNQILAPLEIKAKN